MKRNKNIQKTMIGVVVEVLVVLLFIATGLILSYLLFIR